MTVVRAFLAPVKEAAGDVDGDSDAMLREILAILRARLENNADAELRVAAAEQAKITELRLKKLLAE